MSPSSHPQQDPSFCYQKCGFGRWICPGLAQYSTLDKERIMKIELLEFSNVGVTVCVDISGRIVARQPKEKL